MHGLSCHDPAILENSARSAAYATSVTGSACSVSSTVAFTIAASSLILVVAVADIVAIDLCLESGDC